MNFRISIRFANPGLLAGSYVIPSTESVTADLMVALIVSGESVMRMRDLGSGEDFDIFCVGSRRDIILLAGEMCGLGRGWKTGFGWVVEGGVEGDEDPSLAVPQNCELKLLASVRANSMCWAWSSPTGTRVGLYSRMSAAWRTG